jgi:hypothetical protein
MANKSDGSPQPSGVGGVTMERTKCEIWSRTVGYLRPLEQWNDGKREEFKDRKTFVIKPIEPKGV